MLKTLRERFCGLCCVRNMYCGLCGAHGFAAFATAKYEVYLPMVVFYFLLAFVSRH